MFKYVVDLYSINKETMKKLNTNVSHFLYALLATVLLCGCHQGKEIEKVVKIKYYTDFSGDLMPNGICRFFYKDRENSLDYIETQEKCDCYNVGDTIR